MANPSQKTLNRGIQGALDQLEEMRTRVSRGEQLESAEVHWLVETLYKALSGLASTSPPNRKEAKADEGQADGNKSPSFEEAESPDAVEIFSDGACSGNPGGGGWAAILRWGDREKELAGSAPHTTNNRMELTAVIQAFKELHRPARVTVYTDSQYLQKGMTSWIHSWKRKGWITSNRQPVKNADLWRSLDELTTKHQVKWEWVAGHSGHPENERCDALAKEAMMKGS